MIEIDEFLAFVEKERLAQETEIQSKDLLSIKALVSLGHAINGLQITRRHGDTLQLTCPENQSRFRPGDRLIFKHEILPSFYATLYDLTDQGRVLHVRGSELADVEGVGSWLAVQDTTNLTYTVQNALRKLQPGAPGWSFVKYLLGDSQLVMTDPGYASNDLLRQLVAETGLGLDHSQADVFYECTAAPPVLGVQGPPGTGKTLVLAYVAEGLMRLGKRVVLLAPTHQAINNILTTLHQLFPDRRVKKFGDELRVESLASDIPIITSPRKISKEPIDTIIGLTFMSAMNQLMISDQKMVAPNVVIVDEAGQLPVVQGLCTGLSGAGSILLFGDDKQMPPVFEGDLSEEPLAISVFAQLRASQPHSIQMLNTTYRLNDRLCRAISTGFYSDSGNEQLHPSEKAGKRKFPGQISESSESQLIKQALSPEFSLVWLQVPTRNCMQFNHEEALIVAEIVASCIDAGLSHQEIAVVTPFRRQVMHIRNLIASKLDDGQALPIVDTVERVQGMTVETVVVSLCASEIDYVSAIADFLFSPNRLNVAVSRARTKAIVIASPNIFHTLPRNYNGFISKRICERFLQSPECSPIFMETSERLELKQ
jgi:DNA replication ATP-dependent helicase Dna2